MTPILILAAGASSRMAPRDKLLEPVGGKPMLRRLARAALATGAPVIVVLPPDRPARMAALARLPLTLLVAHDAGAGMSASLRRGMAHVTGISPPVTGVTILPADLPGLDAADLGRMLARCAEDPARILRGATADGRQGHPVVFPADLFEELAGLTGDAGARALLQRHRDRVTPVVLPGDHAVLDLDTPADWAAFRASGRD